jgi:geranylgeranylglycerol-phosphate geranylgeranyltransferase
VTLKAILIGLFGFEGGLILNDNVGRKGDKLDVEGPLTAYWRPFKSPFSSGYIVMDFRLEGI